jgi:hypothetical protein
LEHIEAVLGTLAPSRPKKEKAVNTAAADPEEEALQRSKISQIKVRNQRSELITGPQEYEGRLLRG